MGDSQPNYVWFELEADNGEFRFPPATHFIATVEGLTDMPASGSEDIDDINDDADKEQGQNPPVITRGTATPSYDMYKIDALKKPRGKDKGDLVKTLETQSKFWCPKRRPKSRRNNIGTGENSTPDGTRKQ